MIVQHLTYVCGYHFILNVIFENISLFPRQLANLVLETLVMGDVDRSTLSS